MSEYYGVTRSEEYLAHYGIKGMKWGVRKAIYNKNGKALERHYRKASKHLAKLEDIGNNPQKYAAKSLAYGAAAIGTGTIAAKAHKKLTAPDIMPAKKAQEKVQWRWHSFAPDYGAQRASQAEMAVVAAAAESLAKKTKYGGAIGVAGLGALSGLNAYRAINARKYRDKAHDFRKAMKESFKGTPYEHLNGIPLPKKKKRR